MLELLQGQVFQKGLQGDKNKKENNEFDNEFEKYSQEDGIDAFVVALEAYGGQITRMLQYGDSLGLPSHQLFFRWYML